MQSHIKVLKCAQMSRDDCLRFVEQHKEDKVFISLLFLALNPMNTFKTQNLDTTVKPMITLETKKTINKFTKLVKLLGDLPEEQQIDSIKEVFAGFDSPTKAAYGHILNRDLPITFSELTAITMDYSKIHLNEYIQNIGFLSYPFYLARLPKDYQLINIYPSPIGAKGYTVDGRVFNHDVVSYFDDTLKDGEWVTGYILGESFVVFDFYSDLSLKLTERVKLATRRFITYEGIVVQPYELITNSDEFIEYIQNPWNILIRKNIEPVFDRYNRSIIDVTYLKTNL